MDRQLNTKRAKLKKWLRFTPILLLVPFLYIMAKEGSDSALSLEASSLKIGTVSFGEFQDVVSLNGMLEPARTVQITALQGGRVESIPVEDGTFINQGDILMTLSNADLALDFMNRETQIVEQINNLRSTRIQLDQTKRQVQEQLIDVGYRYSERQRQYGIDSSLYQDGAISRSEYDASFNELNYLRNLLKLTEDRLKTDEEYRQQQLGRIDGSIELMERNLEAIRGSMEALIITAPISGQISQFSHEVGESKSKGESLGRIDVLDSFIVAAPIDQYYLNRVSIGQQAVAEVNGTVYDLHVAKVFPAVENGQFRVHLRLDRGHFEQPRRGQNLRVRLSLSAVEEVLRIPKGAFYGSTGGRYVYVISEEGVATKREIELGAQNPDYFEVHSGLETGDKVILSSYESFGNAQQLRIKEEKDDQN